MQPGERIASGWISWERVVPFNVVDGLIVVLVAACLFYGWHSGVLRQLAIVSAALFALMCASALYQGLGGWWAAAAGLQPPTYLEAVAYVFLFVVAAALWLLVLHRLYPYTRLAAREVGSWAWHLDRFGGLMVGGALGVLLVVAVIGAAELLVYFRWGGQPGARGVRDVVHAQVREARLLQDLLATPELSDHLSYWVPGLRIAREGTILP
jgi:uncharacterized membrane protein required for colicin V production